MTHQQSQNILDNLFHDIQVLNLSSDASSSATTIEEEDDGQFSFDLQSAVEHVQQFKSSDSAFDNENTFQQQDFDILETIFGNHNDQQHMYDINDNKPQLHQNENDDDDEEDPETDLMMERMLQMPSFQSSSPQTQHQPQTSQDHQEQSSLPNNKYVHKPKPKSIYQLQREAARKEEAARREQEKQQEKEQRAINARNLRLRNIPSMIDRIISYVMLTLREYDIKLLPLPDDIKSLYLSSTAESSLDSNCCPTAIERTQPFDASVSSAVAGPLDLNDRARPTADEDSTSSGNPSDAQIILKTIINLWKNKDPLQREQLEDPDEEYDEDTNRMLTTGDEYNVAKAEVLLINGQREPSKDQNRIVPPRPIARLHRMPMLNLRLRYNPVELVLKHEPGVPKNKHFRIRCHAEEHEKFMYLSIDEENSLYKVTKRDYKVIRWELPFVPSLGHHGVPPTPADAYSIQYRGDCGPNSPDADRLARRYFETVQFISEDPHEQVDVSIYPVENLDEFNAQMEQEGIQIYAANPPNSKQAVKVKIAQSIVPEIRKKLIAMDYEVDDPIVKLRPLTITWTTTDEFMLLAEEYLKQQHARGLSNVDIVNRTSQPLKSFVIKVLHRDGKVTDKFIEYHKAQIFDKGPELTAEQYIQGYDAYYWVYLAPKDKRKPEFQKILNWLAQHGRIVRLLKPYKPSGAHVGRSSSSGKLRQFRGPRLQQYRSAVSKYTTVNENFEEVATKAHPRPSKRKYDRITIVEKNQNGQEVVRMKTVKIQEPTPLTRSMFIQPTIAVAASATATSTSQSCKKSSKSKQPKDAAARSADPNGRTAVVEGEAELEADEQMQDDNIIVTTVDPKIQEEQEKKNRLKQFEFNEDFADEEMNDPELEGYLMHEQDEMDLRQELIVKRDAKIEEVRAIEKQLLILYGEPIPAKSKKRQSKRRAYHSLLPSKAKRVKELEPRLTTPDQIKEHAKLMLELSSKMNELNEIDAELCAIEDPDGNQGQPKRKKRLLSSSEVKKMEQMLNDGSSSSSDSGSGSSSGTIVKKETTATATKKRKPRVSKPEIIMGVLPANAVQDTQTPQNKDIGSVAGSIEPNGRTSSTACVQIPNNYPMEHMTLPPLPPNYFVQMPTMFSPQVPAFSFDSYPFQPPASSQFLPAAGLTFPPSQ